MTAARAAKGFSASVIILLRWIIQLTTLHAVLKTEADKNTIMQIILSSYPQTTMFNKRICYIDIDEIP